MIQLTKWNRFHDPFAEGLNNDRMNIEDIRAYCLSKKECSESFPFNETTLVFKVFDKMFALLGLDSHHLSLKCDPKKAIELREKYSMIIPGYHLNKRLWNTILPEKSISDSLLMEWIDHSYAEVVKKFPKKKQKLLGKL